ncbi:hypothetical protein BDV25DRAFT_130690 [Aspergillus avenaceus]|uniref:Rhodopsin domain-containing protein n=1 Tax=Aspergillus avenaceus TaxID=36643 RepID=A0A5N6TRZ8_ASPAV|nr:hypothetical protein BDV25DRAFT_130690 [Aspergillus avenaceus]
MVSIEPGSQQDLQIGSYITFGVAMVVVGTRLYARRFLLGKLGADDVLIILAALTSIVEVATVPKMYECGVGRHLRDLTEPEQECTRKWAWISQVVYFISLGLAKCSMVALYLRLATDKTHIIFLYGIGAIIMGHGIAATLVASFICQPISILWNPKFPRGCLDLMSFNYFNGAFHIITDILLALLPIPIVKKLQVNSRRKVGLIIVFGIGILTICASIARQITTFMALDSRDFQWNWSAAELTTCLEINMCLICASVPAMRSLFKVWLGSTGFTNKRAYELEDQYTHGSGAKPLADFNDIDTARRQARTNTITSTSHSARSYGSLPEFMSGNKDSVVQTTEFQVVYSNAASSS